MARAHGPASAGGARTRRPRCRAAWRRRLCAPGLPVPGPRTRVCQPPAGPRAPPSQSGAFYFLLLPGLRGGGGPKSSRFHGASCGSVSAPCVRGRDFSPVPRLLSVFFFFYLSRKGSDFVKCSFYLKSCFLVCSLRKVCVTRVDFSLLNRPCVPGTTPTGSGCVVPVTCPWVWSARVSLKTFASVRGGERPAVSSRDVFGFGIGS